MSVESVRELDHNRPRGEEAVRLSESAGLVEKRERSTTACSTGAGRPRFECSHPARGRRWRLWDGTLIPVRCGRANACDYCAFLAAQENARVVRIDAAMDCPTAGITTTTRRPDFSLDELRKAEQELWRWLRRRHGAGVRYLAFLEWTTGEAERSGGHRRPHLHHLVKGLPREDVERTIACPECSAAGARNGWRCARCEGEGRVYELEEEVSQRWRIYTADAFRVECRPIRSPTGAISYLALHHHKREQAPPEGLAHVKRFRPSKGYFELPLPALRETARATMADERLSWAISRAVEAEFGAEGEFDLDRELALALGYALRSIARRPAEAQLTLAGAADRAVELAELARRACEWVRRQRDAHPPELVRVLDDWVEQPDGSARLEVFQVGGVVTW